jgi:SM-20-related protein
MSSNLPPATVKEIKVKLLLTGGHEHTIYLPEDSPTLQQLFAALLGQTQAVAPPSGLFQIPIEAQRRLLAFPSQHLIGIITEPPLTVQIQAASPISPPPIQTTTPIAIPPQYVQIANFLDPQIHQELLAYALQSEAEFVDTGPVTNTDYYKDYRHSRVIFYPQKVDTIVQQIQTLMPEILSQLGMNRFPVTTIETQLTAHNDNNYYKIHNDNGSPETASRQLTYVYYFYQEPKAFEGGELSIYNTTNAFEITDATPKEIIQPINNSIIFFPSQLMHEVMPVKCRSRQFTDSRFTVNGWIRS